MDCTHEFRDADPDRRLPARTVVLNAEGEGDEYHLPQNGTGA